MVRALIYALISIVAITFLRMVIGIITKGFTDLMQEETQGKRQASATKPPPIRGELKACKACGTYIVASQALTNSARGETEYYCSAECKSKNVAA